MNRRGFTLIEIIIVLAVLAVLLGMLTPMVLRSVQSSSEDATRQDVERIFKAIVGDPQKENFGYLGDMGRLPTTLSELVARGSQPAFHTADGAVEHVGGVGSGWRGPYLTGQFETSDLFKDPWGQPFSYTNTGPTAGQIVSGGPDGSVATTEDNLVFPVQVPVQTTGTLLVTAIVNDIPQPAGVTVEVFSINNGELGTAVTKTTASDGKVPFRFTVPHGVSVVRTTHTSGGVTVTRTITAPVTAGNQVVRQIIMKTTAAVAM